MFLTKVMVQFPKARFNGILGKSASCRPHLSCVIANRRADTPPPSLRTSAAALVWQSRTWRNVSAGAGRFPRQCAHCLGMTKRCHCEPARRHPSPVIANQCRSTGVAISDVEKRIGRCKKIPMVVWRTASEGQKGVMGVAISGPSTAYSYSLILPQNCK